MPAPTTKCMICEQTVTKRSTLSLDFLGMGDGRACRSHPQVQEAKAAKEQLDATTKQWAKAEHSLQVISAVAAARVMRSFFGWPVSVVLFQLRLPKAVEAEVRAEIDRQGGAQMTTAEMMETMAVSSMLAKKS